MPAIAGTGRVLLMALPFEFSGTEHRTLRLIAIDESIESSIRLFPMCTHTLLKMLLMKIHIGKILTKI
jgi:hypothetical protein